MGQAILAGVLILAVIVGAVLLLGPGLIEQWNNRPDPQAQRTQAKADLARAEGDADAKVIRAGAEASAVRAEATATRMYAALPWLVTLAVIALAVAGVVMGLGILRETRQPAAQPDLPALIALARMQGYLEAQNQWHETGTALIIPTLSEKRAHREQDYAS